MIGVWAVAAQREQRGLQMAVEAGRPLVLSG